MNYILAVFVVVSFATTIEYLGMVDRAIEVGRRSKESIKILRKTSLSDREKEKALQKHSRQLFILWGALLGGNLLAIALPLAVVWLLGQVGVGGLSSTVSTLSRVDFLIGVTIVGIPLYLAVRRLQKR